ncbi:MAG: lipoprotein-releasing system ATP-binding protein LolD [Bdellovibrionaceae bacterium]|nr:lipoprotein-releasing system ATP-binding protein LolD [Pseudobdellovibrionaceae bacterium]|tara:strand:- start:368 stop:1042 length:675 start_codon:yes stop_codon:yes gene_type:complete
MNSVILQARNITKNYMQGSTQLEILKGIDLEVGEGEDLCIVGASGAGKSTLMHLLGTLDRPTSGDVLFRGQNLFQKNEDQLSEFRNRNMGFVFQFHHLLSEFTALENVMMPARIGNDSIGKAKEKALTLLDKMSLSHRSHHYPSELSGGEQQRVAIARALMNNPDVLFADEPTGNLDSKTSSMIQDLFFQLKEEFSLTLVAVTHDTHFAQSFTRTLRMEDGHWV